MEDTWQWISLHSVNDKKTSFFQFPCALLDKDYLKNWKLSVCKNVTRSLFKQAITFKCDRPAGGQIDREVPTVHQSACADDTKSNL